MDCSLNDKDRYQLITYEKGFQNNSITYAKNKNDLVKNWELLLKGYLFENIRKKLFFDQSNAKSIDEIFKEVNQNLLDYINATTLNIEINNRDFFYKRYINAILKQFGSNCGYFNEQDKKKYVTDETGKYEGVGLGVQVLDNFAKIVSITPEGPSSKYPNIEIGDVILKIKQENDIPVSVIGFPHFEVSKLLRGKSGTKVQITLKKQNGSIIEVEIKRGILAQKDYFLKSCIAQNSSTKYGVICFPQFYNEINDNVLSDVSIDFEKELQLLNNANVKSIVLDMRNNSGGSIEAAIKILSNFISKQPVFQSFQKNIGLTGIETVQKNVTWKKNVVIIVNELTKGAAEIIVYALKSHKIGIIIGNKTFGKDTEEVFFDLNTLNSNEISDTNLGSVYLTTSKNFPLLGKPTNFEGVIPDISYFEELKKMDKNTTLKSDVIKVKDSLASSKDSYLFDVIVRNKKRIEEAENYKLELQRIKYNYEIDTKISGLTTLNFEKFKIEANNISLLINKKKEQFYPPTKFEFSMLPEISNILNKKPYLKQQRVNWFKSIKQDYLILEAINILEDQETIK